MLAVVVTGPPGGGKNTLATAVHDRLGDEGVANALIEVDELERCYPPLRDDRVLDNLATVCANFRESGHDLLFVTATIETDEYRLDLRAATDATSHLLIRLEADPATLTRRIRAREPAGWSGLEQLAADAVRLAVDIRALAGVGLVLDTTNRELHALVTRVHQAIKDTTRHSTDLLR
jgi:broad-specificity NMP kinase